MTEDRIDLRTADSRKLLRRLDAFSLQLRDKISVQKGQLEVIEDIVKQIRQSINDVEEEENLLLKKAKEREGMRGVKTPKRKKREE